MGLNSALQVRTAEVRVLVTLVSCTAEDSWSKHTSFNSALQLRTAQVHCLSSWFAMQHRIAHKLKLSTPCKNSRSTLLVTLVAMRQTATVEVPHQLHRVQTIRLYSSSLSGTATSRLPASSLVSSAAGEARKWRQSKGMLQLDSLDVLVNFIPRNPGDLPAAMSMHNTDAAAVLGKAAVLCSCKVCLKANVPWQGICLEIHQFKGVDQPS